MRIAAVFATMNRGATAVSCLRALAAQTLPPAMVVVADNVSTDGTCDLLDSLGDLPFRLIVHRMAGNLGNAGGVEAAMELAFSEGADAVWILDDDSWPRPDALEMLLQDGFDPCCVLHPLQIDPASGRFTWPLQLMTEGGVTLVEDADSLPQGDRVESRGVWTGALISRQVRERVGPVHGALFIRGEDEEYPWRIEREGIREFAVVKSILDHPGPKDLVMFEALGKRLFLEAGLADWKLYYKVRNMVWLKRKQGGLKLALGMAIAYGLAMARVDGAHRIPLWWEAVWSGLRGKLGKWAKQG
jgi:glycosyltransferase involved in cell wall biosynthesis